MNYSNVNVFSVDSFMNADKMCVCNPGYSVVTFFRTDVQKNTFAETLAERISPGAAVRKYNSRDIIVVYPNCSTICLRTFHESERGIRAHAVLFCGKFDGDDIRRMATYITPYMTLK